MKNLIVFGCSFTEGGGFYREEVNQLYKDKLNIHYDRFNYSDKIYPGILAKKLNLNLTDFSKCGTGWPRIFRKFWEYYGDVKYKCEDDLFIFEIPGSWYRLEYFSNEFNQHLIVNVNDINGETLAINDDYKKNHAVWKDDVAKKYKHLQEHMNEHFSHWWRADKVMDKHTHQIITFLNFLENQNIKFILLPTVQDNTFWSTLKQFNLDKHCVDFEGTNDFFEFINFKVKLTINDELKCDIDSHIGFEGYKQISEIIYESINNRW